jgi:parallel beta-helix repeat protein
MVSNLFSDALVYHDEGPMHRLVATLCGIFIVLMLSFPFAVAGSGETLFHATHYVGGTGPGNYSTIQAAINNATTGDTILVYSGTYHESLMVNKALVIIGEDKNTTIIDGGGAGYVITLAAGHSTISGFTITHSKKKFPLAGVYVTSDDNTVSNCILTDNFYGMQLGYGTGYNLIINNTIFHNGRCGVYFNHSSNNRLIGNLVRDQPVNGLGLFEFSNNNSIINNTLVQNRYSGVNIRESYDNQVIGNTFIQDENGLHKPAPEYHTIARDNHFSGNVVSLEEERDASAFSVVIFDILLMVVFVVFRRVFA